MRRLLEHDPERVDAIAREVLIGLADCDDVILWAAALDTDGEIAVLWSVGGGLRRIRAEGSASTRGASQGVLLEPGRLSDWGHVPERDAGIRAALEMGLPQVWESQVSGRWWVSRAFRSGEHVIVMSRDETGIADLVREDIEQEQRERSRRTLTDPANRAILRRLTQERRDK